MEKPSAGLILSEPRPDYCTKVDPPKIPSSRTLHSARVRNSSSHHFSKQVGARQEVWPLPGTPVRELSARHREDRHVAPEQTTEVFGYLEEHVAIAVDVEEAHLSITHTSSHETRCVA